MFAPTIASTLRIVSVTSTTTATILEKLVLAAIAGKSAPANALPDKTLVQIALTPSVSLAISDGITGDEVAITTRTIYPITSLGNLMLKNNATVLVELYYE